MDSYPQRGVGEGWLRPLYGGEIVPDSPRCRPRPRTGGKHDVTVRIPGLPAPARSESRLKGAVPSAYVVYDLILYGKASVPRRPRVGNPSSVSDMNFSSDRADN